MDQSTITLLVHAIYFGGAGFVAMMYGFTSQWMESKDDRSLITYLWGDKRKCLLAGSILCTSLAAIGHFEFLSTNTPEQLVMLGIAVGLTIPSKLKIKLQELNNDQPTT